MADQFKIEWRDSGREPQCPSNPDYPEGIDIDGAHGMAHSCKTSVPYPAKRCGAYVIECTLCGSRVAVTTAGRPDDPRSVAVPCTQMAGRA